MNIIKVSFWCVLLSLSTAIHAQEEVKEKKSVEEIRNEPLSWSDAAYLKVTPYASFYKTGNFYRLSPGQKKTFFEEWMNYGITNDRILDICDARRNAVSHNIAIHSQLLNQAANSIKRSMNEGMLFLVNTQPRDTVHAFGRDLETLSKSGI